MKFLPLLGETLKSDEIVDILECYDTDVVYDFDRTHENMPDAYRAACTSQGFQFCFDADQKLKTIFIYLENREGFEPIQITEIEDIQIFSDVASVEAHCISAGKECKKGAIAGRNQSWARIDTADSSIHYEFLEGRLGMITVFIPDK
jgi:hypothetical protein